MSGRGGFKGEVQQGIRFLAHYFCAPTILPNPFLEGRQPAKKTVPNFRIAGRLSRMSSVEDFPEINREGRRKWANSSSRFRFAFQSDI